MRKQNAGQVGRRKKRWSRDDTELTFLALPTIVWYLLFSFLPMFGVIIAFKNFRINGNFLQSVITSRWVGLKNFKYLFASKDTLTMLRNTVGYNVIFIVLGTFVSVVLAVMVSQLYSKRLAKAYQTAMFMPYFLSWVVIAVCVWAFLSFDKGIVNNYLTSTGGTAVNWYMDKQYWPGLLIFLKIWKGLGYGMVVYLATITGFDPTYYEAAVIDGATKWQQTKYITLPMMKNVIVIMFILSVGTIFFSDFGLFYQVPHDSNSLFDVTYTIDVMVYKSLKASTVGMASASALFQSIMGCLTVLGANAIVKRVDPDSAMI
ncbi:MAG: ABC transporter permease subunit [Oscillospiraceae bacterium]|jgi:putative aldouronate transport system permease protein|nr:ABC transporter permease subunit [Oscillospiraceae bacterium]MCI2036145.1 ABC transporter permease subunit [Oscillospiraceae bacterium]